MASGAAQAAAQMGREEAGEAGRRAAPGRGGGGRESWNSQSVANAVWAFATLSVLPGDAFLQQARAVMPRALAPSSALSCVSWQLHPEPAVWRGPWLALLTRVRVGALQVSRRLASRTALAGWSWQHISNTVWCGPPPPGGVP
jgi:hypothetical protein